MASNSASSVGITKRKEEKKSKQLKIQTTDNLLSHIYHLTSLAQLIRQAVKDSASLTKTCPSSQLIVRASYTHVPGSEVRECPRVCMKEKDEAVVGMSATLSCKAYTQRKVEDRIVGILQEIFNKDMQRETVKRTMKEGSPKTSGHAIVGKVLW